MTSMSILEIKELDVSYGKRTDGSVLRGLDLYLEGEKEGKKVKRHLEKFP